MEAVRRGRKGGRGRRRKGRKDKGRKKRGHMGGAGILLISMAAGHQTMVWCRQVTPATNANRVPRYPPGLVRISAQYWKGIMRVIKPWYGAGRASFKAINGK